MARGNPLPASMLNDYITAKRPTLVEDEYGELTASSESTIATFWGMIEEQESTVDIAQGKTRQTKVIKITARERDVMDIDLEDELSFGNSEDTYIVKDFYESKWKYGRTIMAQYID